MLLQPVSNSLRHRLLYTKAYSRTARGGVLIFKPHCLLVLVFVSLKLPIVRLESKWKALTGDRSRFARAIKVKMCLEQMKRELIGRDTSLSPYASGASHPSIGRRRKRSQENATPATIHFESLQRCGRTVSPKCRQTPCCTTFAW